MCALLKEGKVVPRYLSLGHYGLHLNVWANHLGLILYFEKYTRKYTCEFCHKMFGRKPNQSRHQKVCLGLKKLDYIGDIYQPTPSFSEEMRDKLGHKPFSPGLLSIILRPCSCPSNAIKDPSSGRPDTIPSM